MRIWLVHPKFLDRMGFLGQWREAIMAKNALTGERHGYRNHPALNVFKDTPWSIEAVDTYLFYLYLESINRGYNFNSQYLTESFYEIRIPISNEELNADFIDLIQRVRIRDSDWYERVLKNKEPESNPLFEVIK